MSALLNRRPHLFKATTVQVAPVPMPMPTYLELCLAMRDQTDITISQPSPITGKVKGIEREGEDTWVVSLVMANGTTAWRYIRTN